MPIITKVLTVDVTPEKFITNCSDTELHELQFLIEPELKRRMLSEDGYSPSAYLIDEQIKNLERLPILKKYPSDRQIKVEIEWDIHWLKGFLLNAQKTTSLKRRNQMMRSALRYVENLSAVLKKLEDNKNEVEK